MGIAPISSDNIKVGYISEDDGYVKGKSISQANAYESLNPGTTYIFLNGDNKVEYLTINEVNQLTSKNYAKAKSLEFISKNYILVSIIFIVIMYIILLYII